MSEQNKELRSLKIIHRALCVGSVTFLVAVLATLYFSEMTVAEIRKDSTLQHIYAGIAGFMLLVQGYLSHKLFKQGVLAIPDEAPLINKLKMYKKVLIQSWTLMESVQFLSTILFLISAHPALVVIWGIAFWMMITNSPNKQRLIANLALTDSEVNQLN